MKPGLGYKAWRYIYLCVLVLLAPTTGLSIILHDDNQPTEPDKPPNAVVGRWSTNASFVVVSPKWILTTRHQGTSPATVDINGVTYNCIYNTTYWAGGPAGNADIRLIRLKNTDGSDPNLAYAAPYTTTDEISNPIVIGGYGRGRETTLYGGFPPKVYGYTWGTGANYNNNTQRWCTNIIDGNDVAFDGIRTSEVITADFDAPYPAAGSTQYEGIPAEYDSGGGWFIKVGSVWKAAGLTRGVEAHPNDSDWPAKGESWYRTPNLQPDPDYMDAVRISSYAAWINPIIDADCNGPGLVQGDLNGDCKVDMLDFAQLANWWLRTDCGSGNSFCNGADFQPDGDVDMIDFAFFAQNWLVDKSL
jgi:hypothetical protein